MSKSSTESEDSVVCADHKPSDGIRRGSAGVVGKMMLLKSHQNLHAPFTQVFLTYLNYSTLLVLLYFATKFENTMVNLLIL